MKKYVVTLTKDERDELTALTSKGKHKSQKILNGIILLSCDTGKFQKQHSKNEEIARVLNVSRRKIDRVKKRFIEDGYDIALNGEKGSRIYARKADGDFEAHLVALSCSEPPEGYARWSLRLLADRVVELNYIDSISHEAIRRILKKTKLNRGDKSGG
jgi:transposase